MNHETYWMRIVPGQGLGLIRFGMTEGEVESILGEAPVSEFERDYEFSHVRLEYPEIKLNLYFGQENDFRFDSMMAFEDPVYELFGEPLFPSQKSKILDLLQRNLDRKDLKEVVERNNEELGESEVWVPSMRSTFYFDEHGFLLEFQCAPFFDSDDSIVWPL